MKPRILLILYILAVLLLWGCVAVFFSSCHVLKTKERFRSDSTAQKAVRDTSSREQSEGSVKSKQTTLSDFSEWFKLTQYAQQRPGDTTVINNNYYPAPVYTLEGGKGLKQQTTNETDSSWKAALEKRLFELFEQQNKRIEESTKTKESKPTLLTQLLPYLVVLVLILQFVRFIPYRLKIEKKA